ncbi:MAG: aminotransferase class IV [Planctomycetales bacterium]|nr:aminotransferase class IV [Planctomycetales bacterium]
MLQTFNEKNRDLIVNINGKLVHRDEAGVSPFDSAVQNGDAVWEGLRVYPQGIFKLQEHIDRLEKSAAMLQYAGVPDRSKILHEVYRTLSANNMQSDVHIRLTVSRGLKYTSGLDPRINTKGCSLIVLAEHKPPVYDKTGIRLITAVHRRPARCVLDQRIHSSNQLTSILAKLEANAADADDALMLDTRGYLAETNATHVFQVKDGVVETSTCNACPEGITRATVLDICRRNNIPCNERDIPHRELFEADELFCTGTMGELVHVLSLDNQPIGMGNQSESQPGPMLNRLNELFAREVEIGCTPLEELNAE